MGSSGISFELALVETSMDKMPVAMSMVLAGICFGLSFTVVGEIDKNSGQTTLLQAEVETGLRLSSLKVAEAWVDDARWLR